MSYDAHTTRITSFSRFHFRLHTFPNHAGPFRGRLVYSMDALGEYPRKDSDYPGRNAGHPRGGSFHSHFGKGKLIHHVHHGRRRCRVLDNHNRQIESGPWNQKHRDHSWVFYYHRVFHCLWCGSLCRYACIHCGSDSVIERQGGSWPTRSWGFGAGLWVYPHIHLRCMDRLADKGAVKNSIEQVIAADRPKIGLPLNFSLVNKKDGNEESPKSSR